MGDISGIQNRTVQRMISIEKNFMIDEIKTYAYFSGSTLSVVGEIFAKEINSNLIIECTVYDEEGDIIESTPNDDYGGTKYYRNIIDRESFFNGFPFKHTIFLDGDVKIGKVRIIPIQGGNDA